MNTSKLKGKVPGASKPGHLKMVIYGESGVGKSFLSLQLPRPYFCDSEGGSKLAHYQDLLKKSGGLYFGPEDGAGDLYTLTQEARTLTSEQHDFKTLVVDSLTKPYNTLIAKEVERLGDRDAFGASKKPAIAAIRSFINAIDRIPMNVVIVCHEKVQWSNGEQIGFVEDIYEKLRYELDLCLRITKQGPKRMAKVMKSRLTAFPEGDVFEACYAEITARYGKDFIEAAAEPIALASSEQVAEVNRLLELVKVTDKERDQWNTKAKADSFEEYRADDISKLIEHLKGKVK